MSGTKLFATTVHKAGLTHVTVIVCVMKRSTSGFVVFIFTRDLVMITSRILSTIFFFNLCASIISESDAKKI